MRLWLSATLLLMPALAFGAPPNCIEPADHVPDPAIAYRPSPDVVPADLPDNQKLYGPQDQVLIELRADASKYAAQTKKLPVTPDIYSGAVQVKPESGEVRLNGRPVSPQPLPCPKP